MNGAGIGGIAPAVCGRRSAGFSLLELVVVVAIVSVLGVFALDRFQFYQERAEKAAMESTLAMVRMGLQAHLAELIVTNRQRLAVELKHENPMRWLDPPPQNYAGEYSKLSKSGHWYYEVAKRELVYLPANTTYLNDRPVGRRELRFRVVIQSETNPLTGRPAPIGINLAPSPDFRWF